MKSHLDDVSPSILTSEHEVVQAVTTGVVTGTLCEVERGAEGAEEEELAL